MLVRLIIPNLNRLSCDLSVSSFCVGWNTKTVSMVRLLPWNKSFWWVCIILKNRNTAAIMLISRFMSASFTSIVNVANKPMLSFNLLRKLPSKLSEFVHLFSHTVCITSWFNIGASYSDSIPFFVAFGWMSTLELRFLCAKIRPCLDNIGSLLCLLGCTRLRARVVPSCNTT